MQDFPYLHNWILYTNEIKNKNDTNFTTKKVLINYYTLWVLPLYHLLAAHVFAFRTSHLDMLGHYVEIINGWQLIVILKKEGQHKNLNAVSPLLTWNLGTELAGCLIQTVLATMLIYFIFQLFQN